MYWAWALHSAQWLCLADLAYLADENIFFLTDTDLVAILDLAFYLKEPQFWVSD